MTDGYYSFGSILPSPLMSGCRMCGEHESRY